MRGNVGKKNKHKPSGLIGSDQVGLWFDQAYQAILDEDWDRAIRICKRIMVYFPPKSKERGNALAILANAYLLQHEFESAYQALSEALSMAPEEADFWYNRGIVDRFLFLIGQSVRDFEQALLLTSIPIMAIKIKEELKVSEKLAQSELSLRKKGFTIDQLIDQEEYFHQGSLFMQENKWEDAEQAFRNAINMSDCLPNPQGNLGICLLMQRRFEEAERALKRALEIDKNYDLARQNLQILEEVKNGDPLPYLKMNEPFKGKVKISNIIYHQ